MEIAVAPGRERPSLAVVQRRRFLLDCWLMLSSAQCASALGVVTSYLIRSALEPRVVGIWSAIRLMVEYSVFANLGAQRAAAVEAAIATGAGDQQRLREVTDSALAVELVAGTVVFLVMVGGALGALLYGQGEWAAALIFGAVVSSLRRWSTFALTVRRSQLEFGLPARARVLGAVAELVLLPAGAYAAGLVGLLSAVVLVEVVHLAYLWRAGGLPSRPQISFPLMLKLVVAGAPMSLSALAFTLARSVDRCVLIGFGSQGEVQLGLYSAALLVALRAFDQASLVAGVLNPRLGVRWATSGSTASVAEFAAYASCLLGAAMVPLSTAVGLVGVPLTGWLLPAYQPGLTAVWGAVTAASIYGATLPLRYALVTLGFSWWACAGYLFGAALGGFGSWLALGFQGSTLVWVAWASVLGALASAVALGLALAWKMRSRVYWLSANWGTLLYLVTCMAILQTLSASWWLQVAVGGALSLPALGLVLTAIRKHRARQPQRAPSQEPCSVAPQADVAQRALGPNVDVVLNG
jgi:O-antigen/teichoic acid export membrane protein